MDRLGTALDVTIPVLQSAIAPLPSLSGPPGAAVVFVLTLIAGGTVLVGGGRRLDRGVDALLARPLSSVGYGFAAYAITGLLAWYVFSQVALLPVDPGLLLAAQFVLIAVVLAVLGGFGFAVVGATLAYATGLADAWLGLVVVGAAVALAWSLLPVALAAVLWLCVAAVGLGGSTRRWLHSTPHDGVRDA